MSAGAAATLAAFYRASVRTKPGAPEPCPELVEGFAKQGSPAHDFCAPVGS